MSVTFLVTASASATYLSSARAIVLGRFTRQQDAAAAVLVARAAAREIPDWHVSYAVLNDALVEDTYEALKADEALKLADVWIQRLKTEDPTRGPPPPLLEGSDSDDESDGEPPGLMSDSDDESDGEPPELVSDAE